MKVKFYQLIKHAEKGFDPKDTVPFVFKATEGRTIGDLFESESGSVLACPYPKFSIEVEGNAMVTAPASEAERPIGISCIHCTELAPDDYELVILTENLEERTSKVVKLTKGKHHNDIELKAYNSIIPIVNDFLNRLNINKSGMVRATGHQKYRYQGQRLDYRPNEIIYIGDSRKSKQSSETSTGESIDWDMSWNVRAHWRRLHNPETMGIGRTGLRDVVGYTWISNHKKGEGELREKVYMVG